MNTTGTRSPASTSSSGTVGWAPPRSSCRHPSELGETSCPTPSASPSEPAVTARPPGGSSPPRWDASLLAGCASQPTTAPAPTASSPAPTTPATYSPQLCSAAADYQKAANAVVHLDANKVGTDGVKAALQDLQTAAQNLTTAAKEQFGPQVAELEKAIASLRATLAGLS